MIKTQYDAVIIGSGHNGLVAASYLAKAGKKVLILEKNHYIGGATTSQKIFPEYEARLSRYAYLMSLFPKKIKQDLGLGFETKRRKIASFTPFLRNKKYDGLLLSNEKSTHNQQQIDRLQNSEYKQYSKLLAKQQYFAKKIWDGFLEPLESKNAWQNQFVSNEEKAIWKAMVEEPIGHFIEQHLRNDVLKGVVLTDAKIGVFASAHQENLLQNRTYLYHVVGNKTGEWQVPIGGMGALVNSLSQCAVQAGTTIFTDTNIQNLHLGSQHHTVAFIYGNNAYEIKTDYILCNAAPNILNELLSQPTPQNIEDEGSVMKMNLLLKKLPKLKAAVRPEEAFAGTFHINQSYSQMELSYKEAQQGQIPSLPPFEIYCHTLTDNSILSAELNQEGYHTLTLFGLDAPYRLFKEKNDAAKTQLQQLYLQGINDFLDENLENCIARNSDGSLCIEIKSPLDLEQEIGLPQGNIFHNAPSWLYADDDRDVGSWGVETAYERVYLCGSGAKRGGAVSGIPGYAAAMKILKFDN